MSIRSRLANATVSDLNATVQTPDGPMFLRDAVTRFLSPTCASKYASPSVLRALQSGSTGGARAVKGRKSPVPQQVPAVDQLTLLCGVIRQAVPGSVVMVPPDKWNALSADDKSQARYIAAAHRVTLGHPRFTAVGPARDKSKRQTGLQRARDYQPGDCCPWCAAKHIKSEPGTLQVVSDSKLRQHFTACRHSINVYVGE